MFNIDNEIKDPEEVQLHLNENVNKLPVQLRLDIKGNLYNKQQRKQVKIEKENIPGVKYSFSKDQIDYDNLRKYIRKMR